MIAEEDGKSSIAPLSPSGVGPIPPGGRCPEELHKLWVAPVRPGEGDVGDKQFSTCHPLWDPCYFCAYDHEHGSCPIDTLGYFPRFDYTAFKNGNRDESPNGFKVSSTRFAIQATTNIFGFFDQGFMFKQGDVKFYYSLHAHLTRASRFITREHTQVFAAVHVTTKEELLELSHKGDFGFAGVRLADGSLRPINEDDKAVQTELSAIQCNQPNKHRSII